MSDLASWIAASPHVAAAAMVVVFFAAIVQNGLGMGFGLTAAPLLALLDPMLVPAPTLALGFLTAFWGALREREGIAWGEVRIGTLGRFLGVLGGTAVLAFVADSRYFLLVFGSLIALAVVLSAGGWRLAFNARSLLGMSTVSGLMGTITSVGAPPLALIYQHRNVGHARPTMAAYFAVGCLMSLIALIIGGWAGWRDLLVAAMLVPAMLAGLAAGAMTRGRFDARFRPILLTVSGASAVMLILRGLA